MIINREDVLVVIPAYNEGTVIAQVIRRVLDQGYPHILVVDDGSMDGTDRQALAAGARVVSHPVNRGAGAASQTGIVFARRNDHLYIIQIDADGQHFPEDLDLLRETMAGSGSDIVIGSRFQHTGNDIPGIRLFYNQISNVFTNWFCTHWYTDTQSGFRMLNRRAISSIELHIDGFGYCSEMIVLGEKSGLKITEVPIRVAYTAYSRSKGQNLQTGINTALNILWKIVFHPKA